MKMSARQQYAVRCTAFALVLILSGDTRGEKKSAPKGEKTLLLIGSPFVAGPTLTLADAQVIAEEGGPAIASVASGLSIHAKVVAGDKSWVPAYIRGVTEGFL